MKLWKCFKNSAEYVKDVFYPRHCIYCGKAIGNFRKLSVCPKCADIKITPKIIRDDRFLFDEVFGALKYEGVVRNAMLKFKFKSVKYYGYTFAERMYSCRDKIPYLETALMCCVPISDSRDRTYNQTEVIAKHLAQMLGRECVSDLLYKARDVKPLSKMNKKQRMLCIRGAFSVNPLYDITNKEIVVIDDIYTSGATADECARVLLAAGASKVYIACACYD